MRRWLAGERQVATISERRQTGCSPSAALRIVGGERRHPAVSAPRALSPRAHLGPRAVWLRLYYDYRIRVCKFFEFILCPQKKTNRKYLSLARFVTIDAFLEMEGPTLRDFRNGALWRRFVGQFLAFILPAR